MSDDDPRRPPAREGDGTEPAYGWGGHGERAPGAPARDDRPARPTGRSTLDPTRSGQVDDPDRTQAAAYVQPGGPLPPRSAAPAARTTVLPGTPSGDLGRPRTAPARPAAVPAGAPTAGIAAPPTPSGPVRRDVRPAPRSSTRRRARLTLRRIDPWSVFTTALLLSLFLGLVLIIAVLVLYGLLDSVGVLSSVSDALGTVGVIDEGAEVVSAGQVLLASSVIAAVDVVLITVLATLFAFLYNLVASLTGGIQVTLSEGE